MLECHLGLLSDSGATRNVATAAAFPDGCAGRRLQDAHVVLYYVHGELQWPGSAVAVHLLCILLQDLSFDQSATTVPQAFRELAGCLESGL